VAEFARILPVGRVAPRVGEITYYAPSGNLAIFNRDFGYSARLFNLGRFDVAPRYLALKAL